MARDDKLKLGTFVYTFGFHPASWLHPDSSVHGANDFSHLLNVAKLSEVDTKSTATDVVTEFDRASERLIVAGLLDERPDDAIIGEEGTAHEGTSGVSWLVDPIDGTTNFLYDLPGWSVSIAAATEDGTQAAAVYVPATEELFTATAGHGEGGRRSAVDTQRFRGRHA